MSETLFGPGRAQLAIDRLREFEPDDGYYVAFSGGKDSQVVLDLVRRSGCRYDAHYNCTTVDPPELVRFIRAEYPEVEWHRPDLSMWQLIVKKRFPPTRFRRYCCEYLKERGGQGRFRRPRTESGDAGLRRGAGPRRVFQPHG